MCLFRPIQVRIASVSHANAQELVVGRDALVDRLWNDLQDGSIQVLSERRMGKTWLLHLAQARQPADCHALFLNVEDLRSPEEFTQRLLDLIYTQVPATGHVDDVWGRFKQHFPRFRGEQVGGQNIPKVTYWKDDLRLALGTYVKRAAPRMPVLILDELPHLIDSIAQSPSQGPERAAEVLDTLRALRQSIPKLRMVFCGSLGFHIVFEKLKAAGYRGQPVNDMDAFDVPPLGADEAVYLAGSLLLGADVPCRDLTGTAKAVADLSSRVPFYIQHAVKWMGANSGTPWTPEGVQVVPKGLFDEIGDPAQFRYYDDRLEQYYPSEWVENARVVLDVLSQSPGGFDANALLNRVRHTPRMLGISPDELLRLLSALRDDHYIARRDDLYRFKLEIVRQWWHQHRGHLVS